MTSKSDRRINGHGFQSLLFLSRAQQACVRLPSQAIAPIVIHVLCKAKRGPKPGLTRTLFFRAGKAVWVEHPVTRSVAIEVHTVGHGNVEGKRVESGRKLRLENGAAAANAVSKCHVDTVFELGIFEAAADVCEYKLEKLVSTLEVDLGTCVIVRVHTPP